MGRKPGLAVVLVGDDPASRVYVNGEKRDRGECGIYSEGIRPPGRAPASRSCWSSSACSERAGRTSTGSWSSCPCPRHFDEKAVLLAIRPDKDVDCFHPYQRGAS
ncbi:MAG: tetrahydrofolate dehydrogenase/cyclohydrolase catalytic domain-containing protein [Oscillospiraceae bacterium]